MRRFTSVLAFASLFLPPAILVSAQGTKGVDGALPKDVYPDSGNRLPLIKREALDEPAKKAYDAAVANFAGAPQAMGAAIRLHGNPVGNIQLESPVGQALMQLAIITTAREHDQPYEWSLHEMQALAVGLDPAVIDVVRRDQPLAKLGDKEAVIIQVGREIFRTHKLGSDTYARALSVLGKTGLVDVAALMADYARTCATLTAFNQQMPPGFKQFLPLPFTPPNDVHPDSRSRLPLLPSIAPNPASVLYTRPMTPEGTGPGHIRRHGAGSSPFWPASRIATST
jgi:4-carboxymuconolactone decarboxylase